MPEHFSIGVDEVDDVSYEEVHRQIILIINVLISIVCVAVFVWVAARHWSVGKRLGPRHGQLACCRHCRGRRVQWLCQEGAGGEEGGEEEARDQGDCGELGTGSE
ncbi:hypothetical protein OPT61_g10006 [Boeremia exigua]|uniref:Uncharacterized protein n=1 Tax=Boeremia exigua TaxID=749465 RepID=A0ACC2HRM4_9PLEO|nr:hypothetical protein OPT61_g10006 [Boeremia exigua]